MAVHLSTVLNAHRMFEGPLPEAEVASSVRVAAREGYDRWAETCDTDGNPLIALEERHIGSLVGEVDGLIVADVGCGTGRHAVRLAAGGAQVVALDFSPRMLEIARTKAGAERVRFHLHDVTTRLPFDDGAVDRVLSCLVLEHVADLVSFFGELARVCAPPPRGVIVVSAMHPAGARIQPASFPYPGERLRDGRTVGGTRHRPSGRARGGRRPRGGVPARCALRRVADAAADDATAEGRRRDDLGALGRGAGLRRAHLVDPDRSQLDVVAVLPDAKLALGAGPHVILLQRNC